MAAAAIPAVASVIGGALAGRAASAASSSMSKYYNQAAKLTKQQAEYGKSLWSDYQDTYRPIEGQIADISQTMAVPDYQGVLRRATGDYTRARTQTRDEATRTYARMGIDPSNPMYMRGINRTQLADALALSTARNMAREAERNRTQDLGFRARLQAAQMGRGNISAATGALQNASQNYMGAGNAYGQLAGSNAQAAGYWLNQGIDRFSTAFSGAPASGGVPAPAGVGTGASPGVEPAYINQWQDPNYR